MEPWRGREDLVQPLGRHIFVAKDGTVRIFREAGEGRFAEQTLPDIDPAIRQCQHILEGYVGFKEGLRGIKSELDTLHLPGEMDSMRALVAQTAELAQRFLGPELLSEVAEELLRNSLLALVGQIGAVRNPHKRAARAKLAAVAQSSFFDERGRAEMERATQLSQSAQDLLDRFTEITQKFAGVSAQQQILLKERRRVEALLASGYRLLGSVLHHLLNQPEVDWGKVERLCGQIAPADKNGTLLKVLGGVYVNPYRERLATREITRLGLVLELVQKRDQDALTGVLRAALLKLRAPVKEAEDRDLPAEKRWIPIA